MCQAHQKLSWVQKTKKQLADWYDPEELETVISKARAEGRELVDPNSGGLDWVA
jgi:hypothetical protein